MWKMTLILLFLIPMTSRGASADTPPQATGAAELFVPLIPGLFAFDVCANEACGLGTDAALIPPQGRPNLATDAEGSIYLDPFRDDDGDLCLIDGSSVITNKIAITRLRPSGVREIIGYFKSKCVSPVYWSFVNPQSAFMLDAINGALYLYIQVSNRSSTSVATRGDILVKVEGLPNLLDIIPTFQPADGTLSWVTPKHPEALPAADRFMAFAGDLRDVSDLRRAVAIDCNVTAGTPPQPGDFLIILDPLPTPPVGQGSFVVIGVENAGQRRFGRQMIGGVLSGRDPVAFTGCG